MAVFLVRAFWFDWFYLGMSFFVERATKLPITSPYRPFPWTTLGLADQAKQKDPKVLNSADAFLAMCTTNYCRRRSSTGLQCGTSSSGA
jgi:hypothetical protein